MSTAILIIVGIAMLALVEAVYYAVRYSGERARADLRRRLGVMHEEASASLLRERRVARSEAIESLLRSLPMTSALEGLLLQTDLTWTVASTLAAGLGASFGLVAAFLILGTNALLWIALPLGMFIPWGLVLISRANRSKAISAQLPEALDMMVRSLRAGHGLSAAFKMVATELPVPIAAEFGRCFEENNLGVDLRESVNNMTLRVPNNLDLKIFAVSIGLQFETGGNMVELLDQISTTIRERFKFYGKLSALTAEGKASGVILGALPFLTAGLMLLSNPDYLSPLTADPYGRYFLFAALGLWAIGIAWLTRLTKLEV